MTIARGYAVRDTETKIKLSSLYPTFKEAEQRMSELEYNGAVMEVYKTSATIPNLYKSANRS